MRRSLLTLLILLAFPASAFAATVSIEDSGYNPAKTTITPGTAVTWQYNNLSVHGVEFDDATYGSCAGGTSLVPPATPCQKTFPDPGRFVYHDNGCTAGDPGCITGQIVVYVPPTASFSAGPNPQLRGQAVNFDGTGSASPGGSITDYAWDFGDGTSASGATTAHAYAAAGTYDVKLTVTDDQNNVAIQVQQVTITVPDSDGDGVNDDADRCPADPAGTGDGCPILPPLIPAPIATAATAADTLSVAGAIKSGVNVVVSCSDACSAFVTLARGGKSVAIPQTVVLDKAGSKLITLGFARSAKKSLARLSSVRLQLQVVYTDALTRVQTKKATITLKKVETFGKLPAIGISDNQPTTFEDPNFQVLKLRYARLVTPWNSVLTEPERLDAWLQAARARGIRPLVSFEHSRGQVCPARSCKGPSKGQYVKAWRRFHSKYPWVKDISPWNEVNSATQPTGKRPDLAATYYNVVRASCRGCTLVAADLLDASNIRRYVASFLRKAKGKPRLWGLHNYTDTNRFRARGTNALLQTVKGQVWLTETGGVVKFVTQKGVVALPKSESRAKKAIGYMFRLAEQNATRIKRIYVYQWKINNVFDRFDAGIVRPDGSTRPSFDVLSLNASIARKR